MEADEIDDTIFDRNIDQLDVRETPRWELSEEEESGGSDVETLVNQQKPTKQKSPVELPRQEKLLMAMPPSVPRTNSGSSPALAKATLNPSCPRPQGPVLNRTKQVPSMPGNLPIIPSVTISPDSRGASRTGMETAVASPKPFRHPLDKENIDVLVKAAYKEETDSVKDFCAGERGNAPLRLAKGQTVDNREQKESQNLPVWEEDDVDSVKDFTGNDRQKEEKYMERTDEVIYQRAAEEHIRRPPLWHDDEVDSVRDFSRVSGKQEPLSGLASQQLSRLPSDEHICLSPPWNEEDDGLVRDFAADEPVDKNFGINNMVNEERMRLGQPPPWHEEDEVDSTRDFAAQYRKTRSMENSRRPSEENIYLTPPWMEDERQPGFGGRSSERSSSHRITLEEQRAIQEEARNTGIVETEEKAKALRDEKTASKVGTGVGQPLPGRDSGFCSEQDQHAQQAQGPATEIAPSEGLTGTDPALKKDPLVKPVMDTTQSAVPSHTTAPQPQNTHKMPENIFTQAVFNPEAGRVKQQIPDQREVPNRYAVPREVKPGVDIRYRGGESAGTPRQMPRSISQSSLEANCYSPHDALEGLETSSVVSFASTAATHHDLDTRIDMVQSLLSMLGTHDKDDMSRTLLAMSNSKDSCAAMRQSGCLPLLINLLHGTDFTDKKSRREARSRAGLALHNIVYSNVEDRRGRREIRVLRLLEIARAHCDVVQFKGFPVHPCAERWYPPLRDYGPGPAVAALMKLSFEEEHRTAICELGGLQAIAELVEIDHQVNEQCKDFYSISLRKYAGMTLTNLTFGNTKNKSLLCSMPDALKAIIAQLNTVEEEEIVQVSASVLRNLSWRADDICRKALRDAGAIQALLLAAQAVHGEPAMRTTLSALWNLSAHCSENKVEICSSQGALKFLVKCLNYCSPSGNISVVESSGGILRNLSSHVAVRPDYRKVLRDCGCFHSLLSHLRSPSLRVVSNVCGALWNLSARCIEDQELLWELGAVSLLKSLANSKHKAISTASAAALRNLMTIKPGSSTDSESLTSRGARHYRSMPANIRSADMQSRVKGDTVRFKEQSPRSQSPLLNGQVSQHPGAIRQVETASLSHRGTKSVNFPQYPRGHSSKFSANSIEEHSAKPSFSSMQGPHALVSGIPSTRQELAVSAYVQQPTRTKNGSSASVAHSHSSSGSNHGVNQDVEPSPPLSRSRSDIGPRTNTGRQRRMKARGTDCNSICSGASVDGKHPVHLKWNQSNDSLTKHRHQPRREASKQRHDKGESEFRQHAVDTEKRDPSRSSSAGCAVIPLLCDSYPLHVSHNPRKGESSKDKTLSETSTIARIKNAMHIRGNIEGSTGYSQPHQQQLMRGDGMSLVSPATARRLNQWTIKALAETYEMASFGPPDTNRSCSSQAVDQAATFGTTNPRSSQKHRTQKFNSCRDSDIDPELDIDSEEERTLFGHSRKSPGYSEVSNAWIQKAAPDTYSPRSADTESIGSSICSCDHMENVWIRRPDTKSGYARICDNCNRSRNTKGSDLNAGKKTVKSRRDSSDSPISSPSIRRVFRGSSSREQKKKTDPSKRGVKVTSL